MDFNFIPKEEKIRRFRNFKILEELEEIVLEQIKMIHLGGYRKKTAVLVSIYNDAYAIGSNEAGTLGVGKTEKELAYTYHPLKIEVLSGKGLTDIYSGYGHFIVRCSNGEYFAWGLNWFGQLGLNSTTEVTTPTEIISLRNLDITQISCGDYHTLALSREGEVFAFGYNGDGQIGNGSTKDQLSPIKISFVGKKVISVSCGAVFSTALTDDGKVYTWGCNGRGELGLRLPDRMGMVSVWSPNLVDFPSEPDMKIKKVVCGCELVVALTTDNRVFRWGVFERNQKQISGIPVQEDLEVTTVGVRDVFSMFYMPNCAIKVPGKNGMLVWKAYPIRQNNENKEIKDLEDYVSEKQIRAVTLTFQKEICEETLPAPHKNFDFHIPGIQKAPDVHFVFGNKTIRAHKDILQEKSSYFMNTFDWNALLGLETTPVEIIAGENCDNSEGVRFEVFHAFLHYIYTGEVNVNEFQDVFDLYLISGLFLETELQEKCGNILANNLNSDNVFLAYSRARFLNDENLEFAALRFIKRNYKDVRGRMTDDLKLKMRAWL